MDATHGVNRLLCFVKSKNGKNFEVLLVFLCQYIYSFVISEMAGRGAAVPLVLSIISVV